MESYTRFGQLAGLLHATTGSGKTYAVWLAALDAFVAPKPITAKGLPSKRKQAPPPLTVLWLDDVVGFAGRLTLDPRGRGGRLAQRPCRLAA